MPISRSKRLQLPVDRGDTTMLIFIKSIVVCFLLLIICSCSEDRIIPDINIPVPISLKEKDDVLYNLELAYNNRNIDHYVRLLVQEFIFIFSPEDFVSGKTPQFLNRNEDITAMRNLFGIAESTEFTMSPFLHKTRGPMPFAGPGASSWGSIKATYLHSVNDSLESLTLNFSYAEGDIAWEESPPPSQYLDEVWYQKTATCDLTMKLNNGESYYVIDSYSLFVVRYTYNEAVSDSIWQLARWYDLGPGY